MPSTEDATPFKKKRTEVDGCPSPTQGTGTVSPQARILAVLQHNPGTLARKQQDPEVSSKLEMYQHQRWYFPFQVLTRLVASHPEDLSSLPTPVQLIRNCSFSSQVLRHERVSICLFKARLTYPGEEKLEAAWKAQLVWHLATHLGGERDRG